MNYKPLAAPNVVQASEYAFQSAEWILWDHFTAFPGASDPSNSAGGFIVCLLWRKLTFSTLIILSRSMFKGDGITMHGMYFSFYLQSLLSLQLVLQCLQVM